MIPYYEKNDLIWDDQKKLKRYKECTLWKILEENVIGFFMVYENDDIFYLAELHINPEFRNQGYGAKALSKIKDMAASLGYAEIRVGVFKNSPAYQLYTRSGFALEKNTTYTYELVAKTHNNKNAHGKI